MITTVLLVILGALLAVVLWKMFKPAGSAGRGGQAAKAPLPFPAPAVQPASVELMNVRKGDVISIHGAAADFSDVDFTVESPRELREHLRKGAARLAGAVRR